MDRDRFEDYEINGLGEENEYILPSAFMSAVLVGGCILGVAILGFIAWVAT